MRSIFSKLDADVRSYIEHMTDVEAVVEEDDGNSCYEIGVDSKRPKSNILYLLRSGIFFIRKSYFDVNSSEIKNKKVNSILFLMKIC